MTPENSEPEGREKVRVRKTIVWQASLYPADLEIIEWIAKELGCSKSEAIRSATRHFAVHLDVIRSQSRG